MRTRIKYLFLLMALVAVQEAFAQNAEMADAFRAEGKIYVVVGVVLTVLVGLFAYLFMLDRKITRLERTIGQKKQTKPEAKSF